MSVIVHGVQLNFNQDIITKKIGKIGGKSTYRTEKDFRGFEQSGFVENVIYEKNTGAFILAPILDIKKYMINREFADEEWAKTVDADNGVWQLINVPGVNDSGGTKRRMLFQREVDATWNIEWKEGNKTANDNQGFFFAFQKRVSKDEAQEGTNFELKFMNRTSFKINSDTYLIDGDGDYTFDADSYGFKVVFKKKGGIQVKTLDDEITFKEFTFRATEQDLDHAFKLFTIGCFIIDDTIVFTTGDGTESVAVPLTVAEELSGAANKGIAAYNGNYFEQRYPVVTREESYINISGIGQAVFTCYPIMFNYFGRLQTPVLSTIDKEPPEEIKISDNDDGSKDINYVSPIFPLGVPTGGVNEFGVPTYTGPIYLIDTLVGTGDGLPNDFNYRTSIFFLGADFGYKPNGVTDISTNIVGFFSLGLQTKDIQNAAAPMTTRTINSDVMKIDVETNSDEEGLINPRKASISLFIYDNDFDIEAQNQKFSLYYGPTDYLEYMGDFYIDSINIAPKDWQTSVLTIEARDAGKLFQETEIVRIFKAGGKYDDDAIKLIVGKTFPGTQISVNIPKQYRLPKSKRNEQDRFKFKLGTTVWEVIKQIRRFTGRLFFVSVSDVVNGVSGLEGKFVYTKRNYLPPADISQRNEVVGKAHFVFSTHPALSAQNILGSDDPSLLDYAGRYADGSGENSVLIIPIKDGALSYSTSLNFFTQLVVCTIQKGNPDKEELEKLNGTKWIKGDLIAARYRNEALETLMGWTKPKLFYSKLLGTLDNCKTMCKKLATFLCRRKRYVNLTGYRAYNTAELRPYEQVFIDDYRTATSEYTGFYHVREFRISADVNDCFIDLSGEGIVNESKGIS